MGILLRYESLAFVAVGLHTTTSISAQSKPSVDQLLDRMREDPAGTRRN